MNIDESIVYHELVWVFQFILDMLPGNDGNKLMPSTLVQKYMATDIDKNCSDLDQASLLCGWIVCNARVRTNLQCYAAGFIVTIIS